MPTKYTTDHLLDTFIEINKRSTRAMDRIAGAVEAINDTNVLHSKTIEEHSQAIKEVVAVNKSFLSFFRIIMLLLVAAIIVLAGAEQALKIGIL